VAEERARFEAVSSQPVDPEKLEQLFAPQTECAICGSTSDGTKLGGDQSVTIKTTCRGRDDRETKGWLHPALARRLTRTQGRATR
jgi:hypothetical protein